jgi:TolA-binding protein
MSGKYLGVLILVCLFAKTSLCDLYQSQDDIIDLINKGQTEEAAKRIEQIISKYSTDSFLPQAMRRFAWSYGWNGKIVEEKKLYQQIIENYPNSAVIADVQMCLLGAEIQTFIESKKFADAEEKSNTLLTEFKANIRLPEVLYRIARSYEWSEDNRYDDAKEIFKQIIQLASDDTLKDKAELGFSRTEILTLIKQGSYKQSREAYVKLVDEFAENANLADTIYWIANRYGYANRYAEEKTAYQKLLEKYPENKNALNVQFGFAKAHIHSLISLNRIEEANSLFIKFVADYNNHPDLPDAFYWLARRYEWLDRYAQAANIFEQILRKYPDSKNADKAEIGIRRVNICAQILANEKSGDVSAQTEDLIANFINNPELPETLDNVGRRYEWLDRYDEAAVVYQRITELWPDGDCADKAEIDLASLDVLTAVEALDYNEARIGIETLIADYNDNSYLPKALLFIAIKCYDKGYESGKKGEIRGKFGALSAQILDEEVLTNIQGEENKAQAYYLAAMVNYRLNDVDKMMDYADKVLQFAPEFIHAASMQLLIAEGYEKLKSSGVIPKAEADILIEDEYKKLIDNYDNGLDAYGAMRLGEIYVGQNRITEACACFGWYIMRMGIDECSAAKINRIFDRCERCKK